MTREVNEMADKRAARVKARQDKAVVKATRTVQESILANLAAVRQATAA